MLVWQQVVCRLGGFFFFFLLTAGAAALRLYKESISFSRDYTYSPAGQEFIYTFIRINVYLIRLATPIPRVASPSLRVALARTTPQRMAIPLVRSVRHFCCESLFFFLNLFLREVSPPRCRGDALLSPYSPPPPPTIVRHNAQLPGPSGQPWPGRPAACDSVPVVWLLIFSGQKGGLKERRYGGDSR